MSRPRRHRWRSALVPVVAVATLAGGCSRSGTEPGVAAVVEGTEIPAADTRALLDGHLTAQPALEDGDGHSVDADRERTLTHFVLLYQIKHALLRHLAREMDVTVEAAGALSPEAEAGRLSQAMAEQLFPDVAAPEGEPADRAAELIDRQRRDLFSEWFDRQLRRADVRVDGHFGRWESGRVVP